MNARLVRRMRVALLVLSTASILGCAVGQPSLKVLDPLPVAGPTATVAVWREKQFCGSHPLNYVLVDDRPIAALASGQHTTFQVAAGPHTLSVLHSVIDQPLLLGSGQAALPIGAHFGMYGTSVKAEFSPAETFLFLLHSKCITLDEGDRVSIERVERWPNNISPDPSWFASPGP